MCTEINSAMGLQATAATKRKHEITFDSKDANTYTNCPPPVKTSRWSSNAAAQTTTTTTTPTINHNNNNTSSNNYNNEPSTVAPTTTTIILGNSSSTNSNSSSAPTTATVAGATAGPGAATTTGANLIKNSGNCDENKVFNNAPSMPATAAATTSNGNPVTTATSNCATSSVALSSSSSSASEDSIAKLEVVAAVPCEPWHTSEPVDCISKLQAVAVPSDPWGSISTRSTLATTLLSTDEMDDDDDDFEDDYEEEESIIPTYCPLRYHPCPPASNGNNGANGPAGGGNPGPGAGGNPAAMQRNYSPANGYNTRPNYYSEPFPQQNCSRTGNQHLRMAPNAGFAPQWGNSAAQSQNGFYVPPEAAYPPPQQTIRCAENGKSYLELGCSPTSFSSLSNQNGVSSMVNGVNGNSNGMDTRHPLKRCCDGRAGTWCNTNKNCYKDVRLKIRNLSMFKLSRFRQVSEQSLYRSVLICNTLKYIDREIESEAKEMHQQQQQHHLNHPHHPHQSHLHHHVPHHGSNHHHHHHNSHHHHHQQQQQQQQQQHLQHQQNLQHQQQSNNANGDYSPAMGCARVTTLDYHQIQHQQQQQQQQHNQFHSQQQAADNRNGDCTQQQSSYMNAMSKSSLFHNQPHQHPHQQHPQQQQQQQQQHHQQLQHPHCNSGDSLHPYDHYPFRESQSGRATPFPTIPSPVSPTPVTPVSNTTTTSDNDSGYGEDDSNRSINWSSVLSLSSQSALDPLNNNDLFTILPPATSSTSPPAATPVSLNSSSVSISGTFTASSVQSNNNSGSVSSTSSSLTSPLSSSTPTTFTTLSTISSSTYSLTSSSASSFASAAAAAASTWEYGFLDMDFGLGSEFTELVPSCKLSSDDLFKSVSPVSALSASRYSSVHDNELEHPAHIMVGS